MFRVTIIKLRDILKYIAIIIAIYFFSRFIVKINLNKKIAFDMNKFLTVGIIEESNVIKNINEQENKKQNVDEKYNFSESYKKILQIGSNTFKVNLLKDSIEEKKEEIAIESKEENNTIESEVENIIQIATTTEVVTQNPIKESYNKEYQGVKIKNETDFELTENILNSESLNINTNNIIIFHTHTCESYTKTEKYQYGETRKFSNYRFKLFCSTSWR